MSLKFAAMVFDFIKILVPLCAVFQEHSQVVVKLKMRIQYQNRKFIRNWTKVATISYLSLDGGNFIKIFVAKVHTLILLSTNCIVAKRNK